MGDSPALASFERMLAAGKDGALLRYSLGNEHLKAGNNALAAEHLAQAVAFDAEYTAAWKACWARRWQRRAATRKRSPPTVPASPSPSVVATSRRGGR